MGRAVSAMLSRSLPCSGGMTRKVRVMGIRRDSNSGQRATGTPPAGRGSTG